LAAESVRWPHPAKAAVGEECAVAGWVSVEAAVVSLAEALVAPSAEGPAAGLAEAPVAASVAKEVVEVGVVEVAVAGQPAAGAAIAPK
jgi:hypothetical protein